jgi:hypothetical protein
MPNQPERLTHKSLVLITMIILQHEMDAKKVYFFILLIYCRVVHGNETR